MLTLKELCKRRCRGEGEEDLECTHGQRIRTEGEDATSRGSEKENSHRGEESIQEFNSIDVAYRKKNHWKVLCVERWNHVRNKKQIEDIGFTYYIPSRGGHVLSYHQISTAGTFDPIS